ncbi:MAG: RT0821/Lpp0805 family surface protein [Magnetovibrionaceae bacterium]
MTNDRPTGRLKRVLATGLVLVLGLQFLSACGRARSADTRATEAAVVLAASLAGGVIGLQLGTGIVAVMTVTGGGLAGRRAGIIIADALLPEDFEVLGATATRALESSLDGASVDWENPNTGLSGIFRPIRTFRASNNRYCRQFRSVMTADWGISSGEGVACRDEAGAWEVVLRELR